MNQVKIPITDSQLFAEVISGFQSQGLAYNVSVISNEFVINVTGC